MYSVFWWNRNILLRTFQNLYYVKCFPKRLAPARQCLSWWWWWWRLKDYIVGPLGGGFALGGGYYFEKVHPAPSNVPSQVNFWCGLCKNKSLYLFCFLHSKSLILSFWSYWDPLVQDNNSCRKRPSYGQACFVFHWDFFVCCLGGPTNIPLEGLPAF